MNNDEVGGHHIWCNYYFLPREGCGRCEELYKLYPMEGKTLEELLLEYFPNVIKRS